MTYIAYRCVQAEWFLDDDAEHAFYLHLRCSSWRVCQCGCHVEKREGFLSRLVDEGFVPEGFRPRRQFC